MPGNDDMQKRLDELEIKAAFTEDLLEQLNLTVYQQQQQIEGLAKLVAQLREQAPDQGAGASRNLRDELPPHY